MIENTETTFASTALTAELNDRFEFSICTLVTRKKEYQEMVQSFLNKGLTVLNA